MFSLWETEHHIQGHHHTDLLSNTTEESKGCSNKVSFLFYNKPRLIPIESRPKKFVVVVVVIDVLVVVVLLLLLLLVIVIVVVLINVGPRNLSLGQ